MGWEDMMNLGRNEPDTEIIQREKNQAVNKACMYIYTSGTTGPPKGMCFQHHSKHTGLLI